MKIKRTYKKYKQKVKALRVHPIVREVEDVTLGTYKQISDDSKKLYGGPSPFKSIPRKQYEKSVSYKIRTAVFGKDNKAKLEKYKVI